MLNSKKLSAGVFALVPIAFLCGSASAQDVTRPIGPVIGPIAVKPQPVKPDAKEHLQLVATVTADSVKVTSIKRGDGPPRSYLNQQSSIVVLLKGGKGQVLSRTQLADQLELRVMTTVLTPVSPRPGNPGNQPKRPAKNQIHEHVIRVASKQVQLFLPLIPEARVVEFRAKEDGGKLLGSAEIPAFR